MIGLPLPSVQIKYVLVLISNYSARELRIISISAIITALQSDPDKEDYFKKA